VIGVGGVATADDVLDLVRLGCAAVQVYSALVYEGPSLPSRIHRELATRAAAAGGLSKLVAG
jgi:dihydroorotate dehydrogenase